MKRGKNSAPKRQSRLSAVSVLHYFRLVYRSVLLLLVGYWYISTRLSGATLSVRNAEKIPILAVVWAVFMVEMVMRFFPFRLESPGCQKQFRRNYEPTGRTDVKLHDNNAVVMVALVWIVFNGVIGALHMTGLLDDGILMLICLAYSVCDIICILFFCPFQTLFLKNRCCSSCRIYNWDYAMMFTPCFFMPGKYTWSLLAAAVILLLRWEITVWLFPERFSENTNQYLACANCTEKLCTHKTQLMSFQRGLKQYADHTAKRILRNYGSKAEVREAPKQH